MSARDSILRFDAKTFSRAVLRSNMPPYVRSPTRKNIHVFAISDNDTFSLVIYEGKDAFPIFQLVEKKLSPINSEHVAFSDFSGTVKAKLDSEMFWGLVHAHLYDESEAQFVLRTNASQPTFGVEARAEHSPEV